MKYIILCVGIGKRNNDYSLPKPLNYINGRHQAIDNSYILLMKNYFIKKCIDIGLNINFLRYVTKGLVFGTFYFMENVNQKTKNNN